MTRKVKFLGKIVVLFERSKLTYEQYLANNNSLLFAKILKETNLKIRDELIENTYILNDELRVESLKLINHYDIWLQKWENLFSSKHFLIDDEFIFQNKFTFPKESEKLLIQEYNNQKGLLK